MTARHLFISLVMALVAMNAVAQESRADYRVIPLPREINGIKDADFKLTERCIVNYPTGNRDMERNAALLSQYVEELT